MSKPFVRSIAGLSFVAFGLAVLLNVQPYLIKLIVDRVSHTAQAQLFSTLLPLVLGYMASSAAYIMFFRYHDWLIAYFMPKQRAYITLHLMKKMMRYPTDFYQKNFAGNLSSKIHDITLHTPELVRIVIHKFLNYFFILIVASINMFLVSPRFMGALMIWITVFVGGSLWLLFVNQRYTHLAAEVRGQMMGRIVDIFINMMSIRLFVRTQYEKHILRKATNTVMQSEKERDLFFLRMHAFQGLTFWTFEAICFWWLLNGISSGTLSAGSFVLIFTLNLQVLDQFWSLSKEVRDFWEKAGYVQQALKMIHDAAYPESLKDEKPLEIVRGEIVFNHVHFFYEGSPPLFEDKTVHIQGKQKVGLVGYSGSGKSTFINLILRLHNITSGSILIDGQNVAHVTKDSLYDAISVVPQDCLLFNRTIMDNLRYGRLDATDEEIYQAAMKAQIHDFIMNLPKGYQTIVGERGSLLSGGQRQRIAIARAVLKNAPILLMDEATSGLDGVTEKKIRRAFEAVMENKTVLVIAHRLSTLKNMDRLLVFSKGQIVQDGTHENLVHEEGLYRDLWLAHEGGHMLAQHSGDEELI